MIVKRLQLKFVAIMMGVLLAVFAIVFITLNVTMQITSTRQTEMLLRFVADNDGIDFHVPAGDPTIETPAAKPEVPMPVPQMMRSSRLFYVKVDTGGNTIDANYEMMLDLSTDTAREYTDLVLSGRKPAGKVETFQYLVEEKDYGNIIVFAERGMEMQFLTHLVRGSLLIAGAACLLLFAFSIWLSRWAVRPVRDAFDRQRRFVSDASHELKTPLTIIAANADVLEHEIGENVRIAHIKEQSGRMNELILDMLSLARTDEHETKPVMTPFSLSGAVLNTVLEFESRAFEEGKTLKYDIQEDILYTGNESQIKQMVSIFVDNAIKHSDEAGTIEIKLKKTDGKLRFTAYNTGAGIGESERERIFERFYRSDDSRSRQTGGYGLGLAIAKSIVEHHGGKISVSGKAGEWVRFTVRLP